MKFSNLLASSILFVVFFITMGCQTVEPKEDNTGIDMANMAEPPAGQLDPQLKEAIMECNAQMAVSQELTAEILADCKEGCFFTYKGDVRRVLSFPKYTYSHDWEARAQGGSYDIFICGGLLQNGEIQTTRINDLQVDRGEVKVNIYFYRGSNRDCYHYIRGVSLYLSRDKKTSEKAREVHMRRLSLWNCYLFTHKGGVAKLVALDFTNEDGILRPGESPQFLKNGYITQWKAFVTRDGRPHILVCGGSLKDNELCTGFIFDDNCSEYIQSNGQIKLRVSIYFFGAGEYNPYFQINSVLLCLSKSEEDSKKAWETYMKVFRIIE